MIQEIGRFRGTSEIEPLEYFLYIRVYHKTIHLLETQRIGIIHGRTVSQVCACLGTEMVGS
jgi:hypothetical protein